MSFCRERKLLVTGLFSYIPSLVSCSELCFKNLTLAHFFNCWLNVYLFFFAEDFVENFEEVRSSWGISSFEDSDDELSSLRESSDESSSLSLSFQISV